MMQPGTKAQLRLHGKPLQESMILARQIKTELLNTQNGISPSCVALPLGPWSTVLEFLIQRFAHIAPDTWLARTQAGHVLNAQGSSISIDTPYLAHQKIYYFRHLEQEKKIPFAAKILYQDEHLVVADKPHFLPVTPAGQYVQETLLVRLKKQLGLTELSPVHRLDKDTAGLVLFSTQATERHLYHALFRQRAILKCYEAIAPLREKIDLPKEFFCHMKQGQNFMQMQEVTGIAPNSQTYIDTLEVRGTLAKYLLQPITGRKHQLRLHMALMQIPILGDLIYPKLKPAAKQSDTPDYSEPLQLLAKSIEFTCPITGARHRFQSQHKLMF
jgi:tRNA pseudouridine32 synthase / 23S rRNA pseudouridine746 synthase